MKGKNYSVCSDVQVLIAGGLLYEQAPSRAIIPASKILEVASETEMEPLATEEEHKVKDLV
jgi:hypothetical protein